MRKYLPLALVSFAASAQSIPPQSELAIWVSEDGTQGFQFRVVVLGDDAAKSAEVSAREMIPRQLAERQWCLRGWSLDDKQVVETTQRPKGAVITFMGTCKP